MEIKLGDKYIITSDPYNLILSERKLVNPNHHNAKKTESIVTVGYYGKLEHLVSALIEKELKESEASNIQELLERLDSIKNVLKIDISEKVKAHQETNIESPENKWF